MKTYLKERSEATSKPSKDREGELFMAYFLMICKRKRAVSYSQFFLVARVSQTATEEGLQIFV